MTAWREHLRRTRRVVHEHMRVPALYLARRTEEPVRCEVRLRTRFGDVRPAGEGQAALLDVTPRIKFDRAEVPRPLNAALVVVSESEAYKIGRTRPPEDEWVEAEVSQMNEAEAGQLWQPEWAALLA